LYANLAKLNLPDPQAVFDIDYFRKRPEVGHLCVYVSVRHVGRGPWHDGVRCGRRPFGGRADGEVVGRVCDAGRWVTTTAVTYLGLDCEREIQDCSSYQRLAASGARPCPER
jgi:hypothetical protein